LLPEAVPVPDAVYAAYREVLAEQSSRPPSEWTFKANPAYRRILEHVSPEQGHAYLALLEQSPRWDTRARLIVADAASNNDGVGCPERAEFNRLGITCSPTNLRYAGQAIAVWEHIEALGLSEVHIVEIGGGYGGLALYVSRLARLFECDLASYTIIDLPEPGAIQRAYLKHQRVQAHVLDGTAATGTWVLNDTSPPFLVSCYGFSEFSPEVQAWYEELVVRHCDHGYLVWNGPPRPGFTDKPVTVEPEQPLTGGGNTVIRF
jgi:hypothetical protein